MEELIVMLTEKHMQQMETLIKSTTKAMKEVMSLIKNEKKEPSSQSKDKKKKKQEGSAKSTMAHLFAKTAERNTQPKRRTSVGSLRKIKTPTHPTGRPRRAPLGARGP